MASLLAGTFFLLLQTAVNEDFSFQGDTLAWAGLREGEALGVSEGRLPFSRSSPPGHAAVLPFSDLFLLVIVGSLVSIASFLPMSLLYTGAAPVTKFLLIAGRTDTSLTGIPVISRRAGKRKSILRSFRTHKDHAPFFYIIDLSKKRFNTNNQKIQRNT